MDGDTEDVLGLFKKAGAIMHGHFILSSGLHGDTYVQCAKVLRYPKIALELGEHLVRKARQLLEPRVNLSNDVFAVVSPAVGGILVGHEVARALGVQSVFCERVSGVFELRRGFAIPPGSKIVIAEDVITTGKSVLEAIECIMALDCDVEVLAILSLVQRTTNVVLPFEHISLIEMELKTYMPDALPEALRNIPAVKPGSRGL